MSRDGTLPYLVDNIAATSGRTDLSGDLLWSAIRSAVDPELLVSNLAEVLRASAEETEQYLVDCGLGDLVAQKRISSAERHEDSETQLDYHIRSRSGERETSPVRDLFSVEFTPSLADPIKLPESLHDAISLVTGTVADSIGSDAFLRFYRSGVREYYDSFMETDATAIDGYIKDNFVEGHPRYIINSGIGANEQFNHFVAYFNNANPDRRSEWLIVDSPRHLAKLPPDISVDNALFMEFSRSGKTEETVKIHEYTPREAKRIVFANSGPLRELAERDGNLILSLPDEIPGRFGRNKTPILLAPMHVAGMDADRFWKAIERAIAVFDFSFPGNLPMQIAEFIYVHQRKNGINHIYLGCNDDALANSADEFLQFWNEGVNKNKNDISISRYLGLLRDSHFTIEGILANHRTKMGVFLLRTSMFPVRLPPLVSREIDPVSVDHSGLLFGDEESILAEANYRRFSDLMPAVKIAVDGDLTLEHAAVAGQLWADVTFCYSRLMNIDPGSNPEVKHVRDRSAKLLAKFARKVRSSAQSNS